MKSTAVWGGFWLPLSKLTSWCQHSYENSNVLAKSKQLWKETTQGKRQDWLQGWL